MDAGGNELVAQNADKPFVPASIAKIVTAWLALEVLGADYRFQTRFYLDNKRVLYVRGGGDPFLISEELALLAPRLVAAVGKEPLTGIVLDASYYPAELRIPGIEESNESYDALNSALAVNFNTIYAERHGNSIRSAEKQTPITPLAISQFRARGPKGRGRISLSQDPVVSLKYAGELIAAFIEQAGGSVKGKISTGSVPKGLEPVYVHQQSRTLSQVLVELLIGSNNYIANQVFLEIGGHRRAVPSASRNHYRSRARCSPRTASSKLSISRRARASAATTASWRAASPRCSTSSRPTPTFSVAVMAANKTGTLDGVRTLAGYASTSSHGQVRFVISLRSNDGAMRFKLLRAIQSAL